MKITLDLLKKHKACEGQRNKFAELYPEGAELTVESLALAREQGLEVRWLECLIPAERRAGYDAAINAAWEARDAAINAAWEARDAATAPAWAACDAAINAAAREVYEATIAAAWEVYDAATDAAREVYDAATDAALVAAFD